MIKYIKQKAQSRIVNKLPTHTTHTYRQTYQVDKRRRDDRLLRESLDKSEHPAVLLDGRDGGGVVLEVVGEVLLQLRDEPVEVELGWAATWSQRAEASG